MMAFETKRPETPATFTTKERDERAARRPTRLSGAMAEDLRYLWAGFSADLGVRSPHGALEARLLLAPPRDVAAPILEELERLGGWVCEGRLLRIVALDTRDRQARGIPSELRRALRLLVGGELVERRAHPMPDVKPPAERSVIEQQQMVDWTGFEVRKAQAGPRLAIAVRKTREERWREQDEALERECHMVHGSETRHAPASYEPPENVQMSRVERARRALAQVSGFHARVLAAVYGQHRTTETDEENAVRFLVGGDDEKARDAIVDACRAYREARGGATQAVTESTTHAQTTKPEPIWGPGRVGERALLGFRWPGQ